MKITSKPSKFVNGNLTPGIYITEIVASKVVMRKQEKYSDKTPMLVVTFHHIKDSKVIQRSYPLIGFQKDELGNYVTDENNKRYSDHKKTEISKSFIFKLFRDVGEDPLNLNFDSFTGFTKLKGKTICVSIILNNSNRPIVEFTMPKGSIEKIENLEKFRLIENIFVKLLDKTSKDILENSQTWYGETFDNLYDMNVEELQKRFSLMSFKIISKKLKW